MIVLRIFSIMSERALSSISFVGGLSLAVGSIMGSGILFLPALTSKISGYNVLWCMGIIHISLSSNGIYIF